MLIGVTTVLDGYGLLSLLDPAPWFGAACAWVLAVCAGFLTEFAVMGGFPCVLDHALNERVYCGLAGVPSLAAESRK